MSSKGSVQLQYCKFLVDEEPYCIWDWDLAQQNLDFIESMRPEYFDNVVLHNVKQLEEKEKNFAALSIRLAYFHGMETFFSLICATLQAPGCVVGWLQKYKPSRLRKMIIDINSNSGQNIKTKKGLHQFSWDMLSNTFNSFKLEDREKEKEIKVRFGEFWKRLAEEFVDEKLSAEYNSLKHGLRIKPGGFHMAFGIEKEFGVSPLLKNLFRWVEMNLVLRFLCRRKYAKKGFRMENTIFGLRNIGILSKMHGVD